jgi:hypothetical protein
MKSTNCWRMNMLVVSQYQPRLSRTNVLPIFLQVNQLLIKLPYTCTVKPVSRGRLWPYKTGNLIKEVQLIHMKFSITGQEKRWLFNTGDCLIEVTVWAGLTVHYESLQCNRDPIIERKSYGSWCLFSLSAIFHCYIRTAWLNWRSKARTPLIDMTQINIKCRTINTARKYILRDFFFRMEWL